MTSVQPGYITVSSSKGNINLRIGECSRLEASKPEFIVSVYDQVFYRGRPSAGGSVHVYDLTCV